MERLKELLSQIALNAEDIKATPRDEIVDGAYCDHIVEMCNEARNLVDAELALRGMPPCELTN